MSPQDENGAPDQAGFEKSVGHAASGVQSGDDVVGGDREEVPGDAAIGEVGVGVDVAGGTADDGGVVRKVDGIGNDGGGGVGFGGRSGQDGDGVGNAEGEAAAALAFAGAPRGGEAAAGVVGVEGGGGVEDGGLEIGHEAG